jgi:hypothetical protein
MVTKCITTKSGNLITVKEKDVRWKKITKKMEIHESETYLLFPYHLATTTIL